MTNEPPRYRVELKRAALRALRRLPRATVERIQREIDALANNPRPHGYIQMKGNEQLYRIRVGDWRILYAIFDDVLLILVVDIGPRQGIYRR